MGRLLTLGHFHGITALLAKVGQQPLQPLGGDRSARDGQSPPCRQNDESHQSLVLLYTTAAARNRFSRGQGIFEDFRHVFAWPVSTRKRAKWPRVTAPPSASRSAPRRRGSAPSPALGNHLTALLAPRFLLLQQGGHRWVRNINIQTHNMNLVILPEGGNLDAVHRVKGNPARAISSRAAGIAATLSWSVIAGADAHLMGAMDQFLRSQPPVRGGGMAVQIVNHCVLAVAQKDSCWTST